VDAAIWAVRVRRQPRAVPTLRSSVTTLPAAAATAPGKSGAGSASAATVELSVLIPCLDEAETLATCIRKARGSLQRLGVDGEVVVSDNGSVD